MAGDDDYLRGATSINHQVALRANFKMYSRSAKGGEKGDPNRNPWLAKMRINIIITIVFSFSFCCIHVYMLVDHYVDCYNCIQWTYTFHYSIGDVVVVIVW